MMKKITLIVLVAIIAVACDRLDNTANLPGNKKKFDPITAIPKVTKFITKKTSLSPNLFKMETPLYLLSIQAVYIKPDGTLDLTAEYTPMVFYTYTYQYSIKEQAEESGKEQPVGVVRVEKIKRERKPPKWTTDGVRILKPFTQTINIEGRDFGVKERVDLYHGGMEKFSGGWPFSTVKKELFNCNTLSEDIDKIISAPSPLSFKEIWQKAINAGAPYENVVAIIEYSALYGYRFEIKNTEFKYRFDLAGSLIE